MLGNTLFRQKLWDRQTDGRTAGHCTALFAKCSHRIKPSLNISPTTLLLTQFPSKICFLTAETELRFHFCFYLQKGMLLSYHMNNDL